MSLAAVSTSQSSYPAPTAQKDIKKGEEATAETFVAQVLECVKTRCPRVQGTDHSHWLLSRNTVQDALSKMLKNPSTKNGAELKKFVVEEVVFILKRLDYSDLKRMGHFRPVAGFPNVVLRLRSVHWIEKAEDCEEDHDKHDYLVRIAQTTALNGEVESAIKALEKTPCKQHLLGATFALAKELALGGKIEDALQLVNGTILNQDAKGRVLMNLANVLTKDGKPDQALEVVKNMPTDIVIW